MVYILQNVFVSSKRLAFNVHFYRHRYVFFFFFYANEKREETPDGRYRLTVFWKKSSWKVSKNGGVIGNGKKRTLPIYADDVMD